MTTKLKVPLTIWYPAVLGIPESGTPTRLDLLDCLLSDAAKWLEESWNKCLMAPFI